MARAEESPETRTGRETADSISPEIEAALRSLPAPGKRLRAPEFPADTEWINGARTLQLGGDLKGHVVLLDFWTSCCINCMHMLPVLDRLERKYAGEPFAVIGVHSAKFENEKDADSIRQAVERYGIHHPVAVDSDFRIWRDHGVRAWPTFRFIDANGYTVGEIAGEVDFETLDLLTAALLEEGRRGNALADAALEMPRYAPAIAAAALRFPGKVLAVEAEDRVFIADSGHHGIVVANAGGDVMAVVGDGTAGDADGPFAMARFNNPQGMAWDAEHQRLYVADTQNHRIRTIDFQTSEVVTLAGTGEQGRDREGGRTGTQQALASPWDLALHGNGLFIAMAGTHQIWRLDLTTMACARYAGSGREAIDDGPREQATLAQPSGLALLGDDLYFADSETSALRRVNLITGRVETLIGTGLFDFGDAVGSFAATRLQHPLGVATDGARLFVADTYNHTVKAVDLQAGMTEAIPLATSAIALDEPGGLSFGGRRLFIADTNHHRIVLWDPATGVAAEWSLNWSRHEATVSEPPSADSAASPHIVLAPAGPGTSLTLRIAVELPPNAHMNAEYPARLRLIPAAAGAEAKADLQGREWPVEIALPQGVGEAAGDWEAVVDLGWCLDGEGALCIPETFRWRLHFDDGAARTDPVALTARVDPPAIPRDSQLLPPSIR